MSDLKHGEAIVAGTDDGRGRGYPPMTDWDAQYRAGTGLRWWPSETLIRFVGTRYANVPHADRAAR